MDQAKDLVSVDVALGADVRELVVTDVTIDERAKTVYNFEVAEYHAYFVGEVGVWVNNLCAGVRNLINTLKLESITPSLNPGTEMVKVGEYCVENPFKCSAVYGLATLNTGLFFSPVSIPLQLSPRSAPYVFSAMLNSLRFSYAVLKTFTETTKHLDLSLELNGNDKGDTNTKVNIGKNNVFSLYGQMSIPRGNGLKPSLSFGLNLGPHISVDCKGASEFTNITFYEYSNKDKKETDGKKK